MTQITQPPHLKEAADSNVRQNSMPLTSCSSLKQINLIKTDGKLTSMQLHLYILPQILQPKGKYTYIFYDKHFLEKTVKLN